MLTWVAHTVNPSRGRGCQISEFKDSQDYKEKRTEVGKLEVTSQ